MATKKYIPIIPKILMDEVLDARRRVNRTLKVNGIITPTVMKKLLHRWRSVLGYEKRKNAPVSVIYNAELCIAFLNEIHQEKLSKYESYR